ncbi:MAG: hypothetical protein WCS01_00835, partial [bacterium]
MTDRKEHNWGSQIAVAAIFAALGVGLLYWFVTFVESDERIPRQPFRETHSEAALALPTNRY